MCTGVRLTASGQMDVREALTGWPQVTTVCRTEMAEATAEAPLQVQVQSEAVVVGVPIGRRQPVRWTAAVPLVRSQLV